jgi:hypothetical protein
MSLTTAQLATLKTELQTDPRGYGYAAFISAGSDNGLVAAVNLTRDGTAGTVPTRPTAAGGVASGIVTIKRTDMTPAELLEAIDARDFITTANNLQAEYFQSVTGRQSVRLINDNGSDTRTWANLKLALGNTNGSQTRLAAAAVRPGSRAEELFGTGAVVSGDDVSIALRGQ